eukprot:m.1233016 g.1233016  ORF g.1233016 m.1233016 type:complete len:198 (-) comp24661_c2_seq35:5903-6496(-)
MSRLEDSTDSPPNDCVRLEDSADTDDDCSHSMVLEDGNEDGFDVEREQKRRRGMTERRTQSQNEFVLCRGHLPVTDPLLQLDAIFGPDAGLCNFSSKQEDVTVRLSTGEIDSPAAAENLQRTTVTALPTLVAPPHLRVLRRATKKPQSPAALAKYIRVPLFGCCFCPSDSTWRITRMYMSMENPNKCGIAQEYTFCS